MVCNTQRSLPVGRMIVMIGNIFLIVCGPRLSFERQSVPRICTGKICKFFFFFYSFIFGSFYYFRLFIYISVCDRFENWVAVLTQKDPIFRQASFVCFWPFPNIHCACAETKWWEERWDWQEALKKTLCMLCVPEWTFSFFKIWFRHHFLHKTSISKRNILNWKKQTVKALSPRQMRWRFKRFFFFLTCI